MPEVQKFSLKEELSEKDRVLHDSPALYGMTSLTWSRYINSMRSTMYTSHLKQFLTPLNPDFPFVFTNAENLVGQNSSSYKKVKNPCRVYKKCIKFEDILETPNTYKLFLFDEVTKQFDVVERREVEDLTENFGFQYQNDFIDSLEEGDHIDKDSVLFKSSSYDDDMNYRFGKNAVVMYTLDPYTSEDAAVVRKGFIEEFNTIETEVISIKMNSNDFLINLRGKHGQYKPLPDIGEKATGILASIRTQFNNQILYDFKADALSRIQDGDRTVYINGTQEIVDITIYSNNEEIEDNPFNEQINKYLVSQNKYYQEIYDTCKQIIDSGYEYTKEIDYLYKRSKEMLDTKKRWKEGDAAFSNVIIEVTTRKVKPLANGQKITGRYGNKSVISQIREDEDMPFTEDGRKVDVLLNLLAIINRTTSFAIYELVINAITYQTRKRMAGLKTYKEKEQLLFDIIYEFNEEQYDVMKKEYDKLDDNGKNKIIDDAINHGIFIHQSPTHETKPLFYRIRDILEKNEWLQPENIYVNMNGRKIKTMSKHWLGEMYLLKLKQSDLRGFSARSTGAIDLKGLPTRSYKSRNHMEKHSDSAIRFNTISGAKILVIKFSKTFLTAGIFL